MGAEHSAETLRSWWGLYKAALFESDESKLPLRIEEARRALVLRSRELFVTSPNHAAKLKLSRMHSVLFAAWKIARTRTQRTEERIASLVVFCPHASDGEVFA
jgi:hypothetical protein